MKSWILAILFGVIAFAPIVGTLYFVEPENRNFWFKFEEPVKLDSGLEFEIRACRILSGDRFQLYLEGGNWIDAQLSESVKSEAVPITKELLNKTVPPSPSVILRKQSDKYWVVDLYLMVDGKRSNLLDVLRSKNLLQ